MHPKTRNILWVLLLIVAITVSPTWADNKGGFAVGDPPDPDCEPDVGGQTGGPDGDGPGDSGSWGSGTHGGDAPDDCYDVVVITNGVAPAQNCRFQPSDSTRTSYEELMECIADYFVSMDLDADTEAVAPMVKFWDDEPTTFNSFCMREVDPLLSVASVELDGSGHVAKIHKVKQTLNGGTVTITLDGVAVVNAMQTAVGLGQPPINDRITAAIEAYGYHVIDFDPYLVVADPSGGINSVSFETTDSGVTISEVALELAGENAPDETDCTPEIAPE